MSSSEKVLRVSMPKRSCRGAFKLVGARTRRHTAAAAAVAGARPRSSRGGSCMAWRQRANEARPLHTHSPEAYFYYFFSFRTHASLPTSVRYLDDLDKGGAPRTRSGKVKSGRITKDDVVSACTTFNSRQRGTRSVEKTRQPVTCSVLR